MDVLQIIEELEEEFSKGKNFLFSKRSVNLERCAELVDELKRSLPTALQEARYVLTQKDKILSQAQQSADKTIKEANLRAEQLVSQSALIKKTEEESTEMVNNANKRCAQLYSVTRENIDRLLKSLEDFLINDINVVRSNREQLNNSNNLFPTNKKK